MTANRLDKATLDKELAELAEWRRQGDTIVRTFELPSFRDAIALVVDVATVADEMNHHPDIDVRYRSVTFRLSTHSAGGLTALDTDQAKRIDWLATRHGG